MVVRGLSCDLLEQQSRVRHDAQNALGMLRGISNNFIRNSCNQRQKDDPRQKLSTECIEVNEGEHQNAHDHDDQQETRSASWMQRGKFLRSSNLQLFARFEIVNRLVLSA